MSYSDDEDFNDIYGADAGTTEATTTTSTTTTNTNTGTATTTAKDASGASNSEAQAAGVKAFEATDASSASATPNTSAATTNVSNSLDQLAALQALSSNISQLTNNATANAGPGDSSAAAPAASSEAPAAAPAVQTQSPAQQAAPMGVSLPHQPQQQGWGSMQPNAMNPAQQMPVINTDSNANSAPNKPAGNTKVDLSGEMSKMFVGGLNWETDEEAFKNYFSKYGEVVELKIMREENGRSRGFGFLTMDSPQAVDEVLKTRHILDGKVIDPKRAIPKDEQGKTGKIFVGGIPADVRPKEFEVFFAKYGSIIDAQLMLDKDTGRCRGFGFITYDSPEPVEEVCKTNFIDFNGRQVEVKRAAPRAGVAPKGQQRNQNNNNNNYNNGGYNNNRGGMNMGMGMGMNPMNPMMNPMGVGADGANGMNNYGQMYNPQQMQEYWAKLQEYYQQYSQQTGMDYQQMMMMNPMMMNPMMAQQQPGGGALSAPGQTPQLQSGEADSVPTVAPQDEDEAQSGNTSQRGNNDWSDDRRERGRGRRFDSDDNNDDDNDSGNNYSSANDGGNIGERRFQNRRRDDSPSDGSRNSRFGGYRDNYSQGGRNSGRYRRGGRGGSGGNRGYNNGGGYRSGRSGYHPYRK
ncbi:hypothetical protein ACO0QE_000275 [Hanseniaspora vineae]